MDPLRSVKGMNDVLPADMPVWHLVERRFRAVAEVHGYREIRFPVVEPTALFTRSIGETTDIVEKEMYSFVDELNGERLTLRPEATASVVIAPPEPVTPPPPAVKVEKAPSIPLPLAAKVKIDAVEVRGSLPKSQVRHAVERLSSQLKACYAQAAQAAGHNGFGELIVSVEIDERGRARAPRVQGAGLPHLDGCVTETIQHLITGRVPDTGTVTATWKIVFMP